MVSTNSKQQKPGTNSDNRSKGLNKKNIRNQSGLVFWLSGRMAAFATAIVPR